MNDTESDDKAFANYMKFAQQFAPFDGVILPPDNYAGALRFRVRLPKDLKNPTHQQQVRRRIAGRIKGLFQACGMRQVHVVIKEKNPEILDESIRKVHGSMNENDVVVLFDKPAEYASAFCMQNYVGRKR